ncbi:hypothetical protein RHSIM_Rhsim01G0240500 [Rhododendron simsii]|uniref:Uncharacterized protein n=1 Tax=Rhododendron simsii TaxID=118357 RepID=A0A834HIV8_RHOSS|nr:hypothetical protein RHSIM_Rhsim01G0240500 [Rhododendron simsii]
MGPNNNPTTICHVVAIPYPGRGHINPMMNFCKLLASKRDEILITFVVTEEWLGFLSSEPKPPVNIRFATIPNVIPSEIGRAADLPGFLRAILTKMEGPFERLLDRLELPKPSVIIYDTYLTWPVGVGNRRDIPVASFWTQQVSGLSVYYHFDLLKFNGQFPIDVSERGNELVNYIPGIPPTRIADLPTAFYGDGLKLVHIPCEAVSQVPKAQYLLLTSIYELESQTIDAIKAAIPTPIYSIGPSIPYFRLGDNSSLSIDSQNGESSYVQWLDSQPESSVLYISQGSFLSVSRTQMDEIIAGVDMSGVRFLWVARGDASRIKEGCGGVFAGIPFLTYPIIWDQIPNSKTIVEDWKIGWKVRRGMGEEEHLVTREEIAEIVQRFMDLESDEGKEMRGRAKELKEVCRRAISKGGSADTAIDAFIQDISRRRDC